MQEPLPRSDARRLFESHRVWIMGVLNVTPDSFYEGSRVLTAEAAGSRAQALLAQGADCLDIGAESTRPGALEVEAAEELRRILPAVERVHAANPQTLLSIDTQKAEVARQCLKQGASIVNDVSALRHDPEMAAVVAEFEAPVVLMHRQGTSVTMQKDPRYGDVIGEIKDFFEERVKAAERAGINREQIILDPGIGFGKTPLHNIEILRRLRELTSLGFPILIGISRKSFLGKLAAEDSATPLAPEDRLEASIAAALWSVQEGAVGLRVHDVQATRRALRTWQQLQGMEEPPVA
jgi:dihydropteroate synthase